MNRHSVLVFLALAIGALIIGNAVASAASTLVRSELSATHQLVMLAASVTLSVFLAWLLYRYAWKVDLHPDPDSGNQLLHAGSKLLGIYLLVLGVPDLLSGLSYLFLIETDAEFQPVLFEQIVSGCFKVLVGVMLVSRDSRLVNALKDETGESRQT